jgi:hypothetical protein
VVLPTRPSRRSTVGGGSHLAAPMGATTLSPRTGAPHLHCQPPGVLRSLAYAGSVPPTPRRQAPDEPIREGQPPRVPGLQARRRFHRLCPDPRAAAPRADTRGASARRDTDDARVMPGRTPRSRGATEAWPPGGPYRLAATHP